MAEEESSNTARNSIIPGRPFVKGDKRINRKGRPKNFDMLRMLTQSIASEAIELEEGKRITRVEQIVRDWLASRNFQKQKAALELAYGKVPDELNLGGKTQVELIVKYAENPDGNSPQETT